MAGEIVACRPVCVAIDTYERCDVLEAPSIFPSQEHRLFTHIVMDDALVRSLLLHRDI